MRIDDLNEAPMGVLNRMAQKVVSKVPGSIGAKAQGKLDTGTVANKWKKDYMTYLGRIGQKADTENLKAFLKSLGMSDQDTASIVGESALIERALTRGEIDKIILKAAQMGAAQTGGSTTSGSGSPQATASNAPSAPVGEPSATQQEPGSAEPTSSATPQQAPSSAPAQRQTIAQKAGQAVKSLVGKAASSQTGQAVKNLASKAASSIQQKLAPSAAPAGNATAPAAQQKPGVAVPAGTKGAGAGIDTYINNWAKNINAANPQQKIALAKEVINFLKDRKGSPEGQRGAAMAKSVLKRSKDPTLQKMAQSGAFALERKMYVVANKLLEAVGLTWKDLGYRIAVTESTTDYVVIAER